MKDNNRLLAHIKKSDKNEPPRDPFSDNIHFIQCEWIYAKLNVAYERKKILCLAKYSISLWTVGVNVLLYYLTGSCSVRYKLWLISNWQVLYQQFNWNTWTTKPN